MQRRKSGRGRIVVTGMACYLPLPGILYQVLHYLLALRRLGYEVWYVEDSARWVYDLTTHDVSPDASRNAAILAALLDGHGFAGRWAFRGDYEGGRCHGMEAAAILALYREVDALLNVTGQDLRPQQMLCARRIYIESDPFATEVRIAQGDVQERARLEAHDAHFTFGENLGAEDCLTPYTGFDWKKTRQPVDIAIWDAPAGLEGSRERRSYTTVTSWAAHVPSIVLNGERYYWDKDREFMKFLELPGKCTASFELATMADGRVQELLALHGWRYTPAEQVSDTDSYRRYIWQSRGEFTVARDQVTRPRTGWFSDRSATYLAAGRPVVTQETGFSRFLPTGLGLFAFTSVDEAAAAIDAIESDYGRHCDAAREIAGEFFAAEKVVGRLMEQAGL